MGAFAQYNPGFDAYDILCDEDECAGQTFNTVRSSQVDEMLDSHDDAYHTGDELGEVDADSLTADDDVGYCENCDGTGTVSGLWGPKNCKTCGGQGLVLYV